MHQRRYQLWSVDPLTDDARPISGTYTLASAQRIAAAYNQQRNCVHIAEIRPVDVEIVRSHAYACQVRFVRTKTSIVRRVLAADAYAAARLLVARHGADADHVSVWLFDAEMRAGEAPVLELSRHGRHWKARRLSA